MELSKRDGEKTYIQNLSGIRIQIIGRKVNNIILEIIDYHTYKTRCDKVYILLLYIIIGWTRLKSYTIIYQQ